METEVRTMFIIPIITREKIKIYFSVVRIMFKRAINPSVMMRNIKVLRTSFCRIRVFFVRGDVIKIQNLFPSRLIKGKTNLVVREEVMSERAHTFKKRTINFQ